MTVYGFSFRPDQSYEARFTSDDGSYTVSVTATVAASNYLTFVSPQWCRAASARVQIVSGGAPLRYFYGPDYYNTYLLTASNSLSSTTASAGPGASPSSMMSGSGSGIAGFTNGSTSFVDSNGVPHYLYSVGSGSGSYYQSFSNQQVFSQMVMFSGDCQEPINGQAGLIYGLYPTYLVPASGGAVLTMNGIGFRTDNETSYVARVQVLVNATGQVQANNTGAVMMVPVTVLSDNTAVVNLTGPFCAGPFADVTVLSNAGGQAFGAVRRSSSGVTTAATISFAGYCQATAGAATVTGLNPGSGNALPAYGGLYFNVNGYGLVHNALYNVTFSFEQSDAPAVSLLQSAQVYGSGPGYLSFSLPPLCGGPRVRLTIQDMQGVPLRSDMDGTTGFYFAGSGVYQEAYFDSVGSSPELSRTYTVSGDFSCTAVGSRGAGSVWGVALANNGSTVTVSGYNFSPVYTYVVSFESGNVTVSSGVYDVQYSLLQTVPDLCAFGEDQDVNVAVTVSARCAGGQFGCGKGGLIVGVGVRERGGESAGRRRGEREGGRDERERGGEARRRVART